MFKSLRFTNFKALRDTTLPLSQVTLIVGPNGSGKSTALQGLRAFKDPQLFKIENVRSLGATAASQVTAFWATPAGAETSVTWTPKGRIGHSVTSEASEALSGRLAGIRVFSLDGNQIASPVSLQPQAELDPSGANLAAVLDRLRDENPERFDDLNREINVWLPEFDRVLFGTPGQGTREFLLRRSRTGDAVRATELSHGTLFTLALLTLTLVPKAPTLVGIEEPERGIHPRLLRRVQDAIYRLGWENRSKGTPRSQVVVTTHSPLFLDLFRDHPDEVVIAEKTVEGDARFSGLSDRSDIDEILGDARLGDLWYSGVLGGVPAER